jgi:hypothetical protein
MTEQLTDEQRAAYEAEQERIKQLPHRMVNGKALLLTEQEIAERAAEEAVWAAGTLDRQIKEFEQFVQARLDAAARAKGYDDIHSAALRAGYLGPFHGEGVAFAAWMDQTWEACYAVLAAVQVGSRAVPTWEQLEAELPSAPTL